MRLCRVGLSWCSSNTGHAGAGLRHRFLHCRVGGKGFGDGGMKSRELPLGDGEQLLALDGLCGAGLEIEPLIASHGALQN